MGELKSQEYRIRINEELLRSLFLHPIPEITKREIQEVLKVASLIYNKYFRKYPYLKQDLKYAVVTAVLKRHGNFDPQYRAYNYIYTIARNEMGNTIKKLSKEKLSGDLAEEYDIEDKCDVSDLPNVQIIHWLAGDFEGAAFDVPDANVYQLLEFIEATLGGTRGRDMAAERVALRLLETLK